ncbi:polysaccharide deacetylase family protein [Cylindrospermum sp. FACHB-282]|uniref:polysaccharide deacetylase family protein n=1 Tax=Cylindrospermum sp. FACHB-282 TaxID=2692794 RepID=UPI0016870058|nr:polysaccharide deacetylase family protein [Cylindrospermum sp. FACHB-282]MBD2387217.1 polysaccharide deacetylase family protein [Cylindrospermum sp. FACHB-282]
MRGTISKLWQVTRQFPKRFFSQGLILMYHRIAEQDIDPWSLCVTPENFSEQLAILQQYTQPMSLQELAQAQQAGKIPSRAVAITFDDGYANNLHNAKPILESYHIPATVFVTTGYIGRNREYWWDELEQILLKPGKLPEKLCLNINGSSQEWKLGKAVNYSQEEHQHDYACPPWEAKPGSRLFFYYSVWQQLQSLFAEQQQQILDRIITWANADAIARPTHRPMNLEEVRALEKGNLIEVGAHTITHPFLHTHTAAFQQQEIEQSKQSLEESLGHSVNSFAYPFGAYNQDTVSLVKKANFNCACSTVEETAWKYNNRFLLPRFEVKNWDKNQFKKILDNWL